MELLDIETPMQTDFFKVYEKKLGKGDSVFPNFQRISISSFR